MIVRHTETTGMATAPKREAVQGGEEYHAACGTIAQVLERIGNKWTVLVVVALADGPQRFNALMRLVEGVSHRMLTLTLRGLQRDGMVKRRAYATIPPKVQYELTPLGQSLIEPLGTLADWAMRNRTKIETAQTAFDADPSATDETTS
ncbi:helix-turn-helix transcriptional regulator [Microbacteriaceae bacterium K1510]|nr:helix-turn-helix transcriptional regulator [Microbacteriaceae bacterium K1510]